jgi:hypothetical protein
MQKGWGEAQVVERLPGKHETLSSIPSTSPLTKNKKDRAFHPGVHSHVLSLSLTDSQGSHLPCFGGL